MDHEHYPDDYLRDILTECARSPWSEPAHAAAARAMA